MADMFVNDGGSNTSPYDTWAKAANKLGTALSVQAAGEIIYIASNHVETEGANYTPDAVNGTPANPIRVISVQENTTTFEKMSTGGGSINAGSSYTLIFDGAVVYLGCKFTSYIIKFDDNDVDTIMDRCRLEVASYLQIGLLGDQAITWKNVDLVFTGNAHINAYDARFRWSGGSLIFDGGSCNNAIFASGGRGGTYVVEDVDLSALITGDYLVHNPLDLAHDYLFKRCKLSSTLSGVIDSAITGGAPSVKVHSCSYQDIINQFEEQYFEGAIYSDTGVYLNATYDGSNGYSTKMVTNTNASEYDKPLRFKLADIYIDSIGKTLTVELVLDGATTLNNDDFWIEVEYPDSTIAAFGNILSTIMTNPTDTPSALTSSSVSWTGTGGFSNEQKRKVTADFTGVANEAVGVYTVWACLAKPSTTVYVDPKITVA